MVWIRALSDGLLKSKGRRLPNSKTPDDLAKVKNVVKAFIRNPSHPIPKVFQFQQAVPIDFNDPSLELVPEVYLEQEQPTRKAIIEGLEDGVRRAFSYLVAINKAVIKGDLIGGDQMPSIEPFQWREFRADDMFTLKRGHFHSISSLDEGQYPTISRVSINNGLVGFYDIPEAAKVFPARTISVSSVGGDAFVQPVPFIATDNVVVCAPKGKYCNLSVSSLYFIALMLNMVKWRYSYGRQCYKTKFATTKFFLPITRAGELDEDYMEMMVRSTKYWRLVEASIE